MATKRRSGGGLGGASDTHVMRAFEMLKEADGHIVSAQRVARGGDCRALYESLRSAHEWLARADQEARWSLPGSGRKVISSLMELKRAAARLDLAFRENCIED